MAQRCSLVSSTALDFFFGLEIRLQIVRDCKLLLNIYVLPTADSLTRGPTHSFFPVALLTVIPIFFPDLLS